VMNGTKASMVFTDPPYNVPIAGNVSTTNLHREFAMASGEMTKSEFTRFLMTVCTLLTKFTTHPSVHYLCMDWRHIGELFDATNELFTELINVCVWVKNNAGLGSLYRSQHELIFVFRNGSAAHRNNVQLGKFGRDRTNVWQYSGAPTFSRSGEEGNLLAQHPCVKNAAMVADAIMDVTARGEVVLDPFIGSGTTIVAAERTGRRCYGIEIDPLYVDVAIRRWEALTRDRAVHAATGRSFAEIEAEARNGGRQQP
jgi:DNA modification methylase